MKKSVIIFVLLSLLPEVCFAADMLPDSVAYRAGKWFQYVPYAHLLYADEHPEYFREAAADPRCFTYSVFVGARYNMPHYDGYFSRVAMGVRAYCGNYPYGMFRSIDNFSHIGICVVYQ